MDMFLVLAVAVCILNYFLLWMFYRKFKTIYAELVRKIQEIGLENELSNVFAPNSSQGDILKITNDLFRRIKITYEIEANSYSELVTHLRQSANIDEDLKNMLIDYFETVTLISYRDQNVTDAERAEIKSKLKLIIKMLPSEAKLLEGMKL